MKGVQKLLELKNDVKEDNRYAYWRGEQEGWGYAVMDYTDGSEFLDPKTRKLWFLAGNALIELKKYLKKFKDYEEEI